jgi:hypothetical protein
MTALAADINNPRRDGVEYAYPMAASVTAYMGGLAVLDASGNCKPGVAATGLTAVGIFIEQKTNGATAAAVTVLVSPGVYRFENSAAGDAITKAEIGDTCYIVDDATVAKTDGTGARSAAGKIVDVDANGVWVKIGI